MADPMPQAKKPQPRPQPRRTTPDDDAPADQQEKVRRAALREALAYQRRSDASSSGPS